MNRQEWRELFNKRPRIGALATSNKLGEVNVAVFGSPHMVDENTIAKAAGQRAADMIHAAIRFRITDVRPIVEMG